MQTSDIPAIKGYERNLRASGRVLKRELIAGKNICDTYLSEGERMKIVLLALAMLTAACASPPPPAQTRDKTTTTASPSSLSRDTSDCERQAALAGAGERAKAFENCMRAKKTPQR